MKVMTSAKIIVSPPQKKIKLMFKKAHGWKACLDTFKF